MLIQCPQCGFGRDVPEEKIPESSTRATCPKCGHKFNFREEKGNPEYPFEPETQETTSESGGQDADSIWSQLDSMGRNENGAEAEPVQNPEGERFSGNEVPWENLEEEGFFPGILGTIKRAMFGPSAFFCRMPLKGLAKPLIFYLILTEIQAVATFLWQMLGLVPMMGMHGQKAGMVGVGIMGIGSLALLIIYPLVLTVMLFIVAGINHLLLKICGAANKGFEGTFRVVTYGNAPMVLGIIPFFGAIVGGLWTMIVTVIGYKTMHETTYGRVVFAFLLPFILAFVLVVVGSIFAG